MAGVTAAADLFDLDNISTIISKLLGAKRPGYVMGQIKYFDLITVDLSLLFSFIWSAWP
jgi:uncharacterized membrane protein